MIFSISAFFLVFSCLLLLSKVKATPTFNHSWDTLSTFYFSANTDEYESQQQLEFISKYGLVIFPWQTAINMDPKNRHGEDKIHNQVDQMRAYNPEIEIMMYMQGQLAMDWYEYTRVLLPPPCGTDSTGEFTDYFLMNASSHTPAHWPSYSCDGYDLNYDFSQEKVVDYYVNNIVKPYVTHPAVNIRNTLITFCLQS